MSSHHRRHSLQGHTAHRPKHRSPSRCIHTAHTGPARTGCRPPSHPQISCTMNKRWALSWEGHLLRPELGTVSVGHQVQSTSVPSQVEGLLPHQTSVTPAGGSRNNLRSICDLYRPEPLGKGAAWFFRRPRVSSARRTHRGSALSGPRGLWPDSSRAGYWAQ